MRRRPARTVEVYGIVLILYALGARVRMVRPLGGVFDRVKLSYFHPGLNYDVHPSLGHYLVSQRVAEEVRDMSPMLMMPIDGTYVDELFELVTGGGVRVTPRQRVKADSTPGRSRRKKH
jgi:hypothetical protein